MPRPVDHQRREDLLERAVDHVCAVGLGGLSMRALATALEVDASLLAYHFGSKQTLFALVLNRVRDRLRAVGGIDADEPLAAVLDRVWSWATDPAHRSLYLLFFEVYAGALRSPQDYRPFLDTVVADWLGPLTLAYQQAGYDPRTAEARATLAVALTRGLLLDLLTTGDHHRIDTALHDALRLLA